MRGADRARASLGEVIAFTQRGQAVQFVLESAHVELEEIRERARRPERRVARRNQREYIAAVVVVFGYGLILWRVPFATARIGAGLIIAATIFICYRLHVHGSAESLRTDVA